MTRVLVDTSVWSLALRKREHTEPELKYVSRLSQILRDLQLVMIGPIRQEILSGLSDQRRYEEFRQKIAIVPDHPVSTQEYELAARFHNECRQHGIQGFHVDFLICAVAQNNGFRILTLDHDFLLYQQYVGITLEKVTDA
jgi:predicted nucleic acid-binding protein